MEENEQSDNQEKYRTRFKPGQSGNPSGRPKGSFTFQGLLDRLGDRPIKDTTLIPEPYKSKILEVNPEATFKEAVAISAYIGAITGNRYDREFIADRTEGKAPQTITVREEHVIIDIIEDDSEDENDDQTDNTNPDTDNGSI